MYTNPVSNTTLHVPASPLAFRGRIAVEEQGEGPPVLLLHGVALGPGTFRASARAVAAGGARAIVPHRSGYAGSASVAPARDLDGQIEDLVGVLDALGLGAAVWVGASGGATIALAAALRVPDRVAAVIVHEPALGPLAPALLDKLRAAAASVREAADPGEAALRLAASLGGEGWPAVSGRTRDDIRAAGPAVRAEIPMFPAFAPTPDDLHRLRGTAVVSSVGRRSGPERHDAGDALVRHAAATPVLTPSGHFVQLEAPTSLAAVALELAAP